MKPSSLIPPNEQERLQVLYESNILNSNKNDSDYDRYTALCVRLFDVKSSNIILVRETSIFVKSVAPQANDTFDYPRSPSIVENYVFPDSTEVFVVPDMLVSEHYSPAAQKKFDIRFIAGAAIIVEDMIIGFLGITDDKPRPLSSFGMKQQMNLFDIATSISSLISERRRSYMKVTMSISSLHPYSTKSSAPLAPTAPPSDIDDDLLVPSISPNILKCCWGCNLSSFLLNASTLLSKMLGSQSKSVDFLIHLGCFETKDKVRTTYANAVFAVIVSSACYASSFSDHVEIRVGFVKSHSYRNHISLSSSCPQQSVVDGKIKIEVHFTKMSSHPDQEAVRSSIPFDKLVYEALDIQDDMITPSSHEAFASHFHGIDDLLRDINGSSRYSELEAFDVQYTAANPSSSFVNCVSSRMPSEVNAMKKCFYDFSIPCQTHN